MVGSPAPAFTRPGLDGKPVALKDYRGKVVLVDFWASWCAPCIIAMPELIGLQKKHAGKLQIIGVSMDEDASSAKAVAHRFAFNYPLLMGDAKFGHLFGGILGMPSAFLIGRDGKIVKILRGEPKPGELDRAIQSALSS
jgi:thiol-disulfide isomerase/thioredoxin